MTGLKDWSTTPASNSDSPPYGAPEDTTLISDLNDIDREIMAEVRGFYEALEWRNLGLAFESSGPTLGIVLTGTVASYFSQNQRIYLEDASTSFYGYIASIAEATNTTLTVVPDGGTPASITYPLTLLKVGINPSNRPIAGSSIGGNLLQAGNLLPSADNTYDIGAATTNAWKDIYIDGVAYVDNLKIAAGETVNLIRDEDTMSSDDENALATQQSIKAYADSRVKYGGATAPAGAGVLVYKSTVTAYSAGLALTAENHGLGGAPDEIDAYLKVNAAGTSGFAAGDIVKCPVRSISSGTTYGVSIWGNATQIDLKVAATGILIIDKSGSDHILGGDSDTWYIWIVAKRYVNV